MFSKPRILIVAVLGVLALAPTFAASPYDVFKSSDVVKRREAVLAIGQDSATLAVPTLLKASHDKDDLVRALAVQGLGAHRATVALPRLRHLLASDTVLEVRENVVDAIALIPSTSTVQSLTPALTDHAETVRLKALQVLVRQTSRAARRLIVASIENSMPPVRRAALYWSAQLQLPAAEKPALHALDDEDAATRANAALTLAALQSEAAIPQIQALCQDDDDPSVRATAARALGMMDDDGGESTALELVSNPDRNVRLLAIDALGYSSDPAVLSRLQALSSDPDPAVQRSLRDAIARVSGREKPTHP